MSDMVSQSNVAHDVLKMMGYLEVARLSDSFQQEAEEGFNEVH